MATHIANRRADDAVGGESAFKGPETLLGGGGSLRFEAELPAVDEETDAMPL
jgi:hypothetical protein